MNIILRSQARNTRKEDLSRYYEINSTAARFFFDNLTKHANPGYTYIRKRGISDETIKRFGLGYSPNSWNSLYKFLQDKGVSDEDMLKLGLVTQGKKVFMINSEEDLCSQFLTPKEK